MTRHVLLEDKKVSGSRDYVQFRRVTPNKPLEVIEMDIKYVWISGARKYAFVLTVIDTFTRYVLDYSVGYSMTSLQIQQSWEYIISTHYQPLGLWQNKIDVEVRSDN
jgi:transposase InsO family protein